MRTCGCRVVDYMNGSRQDIGSHVLTIRCTRKLLERLDVEASSVPLHPTNRPAIGMPISSSPDARD